MFNYQCKKINKLLKNFIKNKNKFGFLGNIGLRVYLIVHWWCCIILLSGKNWYLLIGFLYRIIAYTV